MSRISVIGLLLAFAPMLWAAETKKDSAADKPKAAKSDVAKSETAESETPLKDTGIKTETIVTQETAQKQTVPPPTPNYSGDIMHRSTLSGDWGGLRNDLAAKGITLDVQSSSIAQGNAHGGASTDHAFRYSGSAHYTLTIDTQKAGLWPGGTILVHAENKWGNGIQDKVGSLIPVNLDAYKPSFDRECIMSLSEWILFQALCEGKIVLVAGKLDGSRAFDRNVFANDERTQFMNLAFRNNPMIGAFLPYTTIGAGVIVNPTDWLSILTAVADTDGSATAPGFKTAFHGAANTTVINEIAAKVKPFGLDGNQRVGWIWSSKNFKEVSPVEPFRSTAGLVEDLLGPHLFRKVGAYLPFKHAEDNVAVYYNFDQYLYQKADDRTQGIGLFGRFGWARQDVNPVRHFYSIGVGGRGLIPDRAHDAYGVGYYYADLSPDLPPGFYREQGVEMYYNVEITPWLHISPDLQVIMEPGGNGEKNTALVYGFRMSVDL